MDRRWGSCTPATGAVRVSDRLAGMPDRVLDYVLIHELAHLQVPDHSPAFHALVDRYPHTDWARGFLDGVHHAQAQVSSVPSASPSESSGSPAVPSSSPSGPSPD